MSKMTSKEWRAITALSTIMSLRMMGLFMVLPVFSLYAYQLTGATPLLLGMAMGVYGLCQAIFQIPFGALSDRFGRKPIILLGLLLFCAGSLIAGLAHSIHFMILGRALQGVGAVGSTLLALMADLTREEERTKAMAIAGIAIGFSFTLAMLIGPVLIKWITVNDLFFLAVIFGIFAILMLYFIVPAPPRLHWQRDTTPEFKAFFNLLKEKELAKLNAGIFILHALFTASFIVIPISLSRFTHISIDSQWMVYLPALLTASALCLGLIGAAEQQRKIKIYFLGGIATLALALVLLWLCPTQRRLFTVALCLFFASFSLLEAFLPSLVSRTAPASRKGTALGLYSCAQFLGIFVGGALGGWLYGQFSFPGVYLFCIFLAIFWLALALLMQPPRYLITQTLRLLPAKQSQWHTIVTRLRMIPGITEAAFIAEDGLIYLKMERGASSHPDFIRLKEQLQLDSL